MRPEDRQADYTNKPKKVLQSEQILNYGRLRVTFAWYDTEDQGWVLTKQSRLAHRSTYVGDSA